jgi:hypothetical protein
MTCFTIISVWASQKIWTRLLPKHVMILYFCCYVVIKFIKTKRFFYKN